MVDPQTAPEKRPLRVLVVGAGAVGQVFALHLARGGADVAFLVKPKYAEECGRGFTLYRLGGRVPTIESVTCRALTSAADAAREHWAGCRHVDQ